MQRNGDVLCTELESDRNLEQSQKKENFNFNLSTNLYAFGFMVFRGVCKNYYVTFS